MLASAPPEPQPKSSYALLLASQPEAKRQEILNGLSLEAKALARYTWWLWARGEQYAPLGEWRSWAIIAGRGFGKTRAGAEWVRGKVEFGGCRRIALVGRTVADVRDTMVQGESGILSVCPPWNRPVYQPTKRRLVWPNGAIATTYSADNPDELRGPQHDAAWCDELAAWQYAQDAFDQLSFGLRLGTDPRIVVTTTPRPIKVVKDLLLDPTTVTTRGSTYENRENLARAFIDRIIKRYEGTRLGRQELDAEILSDNPGALWTLSTLEGTRITSLKGATKAEIIKTLDLIRIVVGVDPGVASGEEAAETGIIVAGLGGNHHGYLLEDCTMRGTPAEWGARAVRAYTEWRADRLVAEINQGGEMVEHTLRTVDPSLSYTGVHAKRGKYLRAEPVSALYEQRRVHHIGMFAALEDQMTQWLPDDPKTPSPNNLDAAVYAMTELMLGGPQPAQIGPSIW